MSPSLAEQWAVLSRNQPGSLVELVAVPGAGRGLISRRDLVAGEVVLEDLPIVIGPSENSGGRDCDGCYVDKAREECTCGLRFCSGVCKERWHSTEECQVIGELPQPPPRPASWLLVLRAALCKDQRIGMLEGDNTTHLVSSQVLSRLGISSNAAALLNSVLASNTFRRGSGRCLCPAVAMVNHSCVANCRVHWEQGDKLVLTAKKQITAGEQLTITYCSALLGTYARQNKLRKSKGFQCACPRCLDPSESGTNIGGLSCTKCGQGCLLPHVRRDQVEIDWFCHCGFQANSSKVSSYLTKLEAELADLEQLGTSDMNHLRTKIQLFTTWIQKKSKLLPPSSDLLLRAGGSLGLLLSHMGTTRQVVERREDLIKQRINVLDMVDGMSMSRLKGFELFKLYLVLSDKLTLLTSQKTDDHKVVPNLELCQQLALVEAQYLVGEDTLAPGQISRAGKDLKNREHLQQMVLDKYK